MYHIIKNQLELCNINNVDEFILSRLDISKFNFEIPTSSKVYKKQPLPRFNYIEHVFWEKEDNSIIIHVPQFYDTEELRYESENILPELEGYLINQEGHAIIAYHKNPYPAGMDNEEVKKRVDYNLPLITQITEIVKSTIAKNQKLQMLCGHLHSSNDRYIWKINAGDIELIPLGIKDIALLNEKKGTIKIKKYD